MPPVSWKLQDVPANAIVAGVPARLIRTTGFDVSAS
jgi:acetyltransferase-like isoleucine patch superfamily enzyme